MKLLRDLFPAHYARTSRYADVEEAIIAERLGITPEEAEAIGAVLVSRDFNLDASGISFVHELPLSPAELRNLQNVDAVPVVAYESVEQQIIDVLGDDDRYDLYRESLWLHFRHQVSDSLNPRSHSYGTDPVADLCEKLETEGMFLEHPDNTF